MGGSSRTWEGHAPLKAALDALATAKGVSANRVKAVASAAFQYAKDYKRVVHDVEIFLWKAEVEHRLAGLYAMDAIMRQSQAKLGSKDVFVKRFALHMSNTIAAVKKIPADQQENVRHVIEEWQSRGYYSPQEIEQAGGHEFSLNNPRARTSSSTASAASAAGTRVSPTHADPASKEKLASLLSIIKKQKELTEHKTDQPQPQPLPQPQPPLLATPPSQRLQQHQAPSSASLESRRLSTDDRSRARSGDNCTRDHDTPPRDRGRDRGRERSRSRSRDHAQGGRSMDRGCDRSRDRSRGRTEAGPASRDRRTSPLMSSPARSRSRQSPGDFGRRDSLEDSRDAKKPRNSRWGPARAADAAGGDDNRPPVIDTRDHERSGRFESRSPRNRYDGPPGPGPAPGSGTWPPTGYQGPPPPFRSGPPPNSFPPLGPQGDVNGYNPLSRGGADLPNQTNQGPGRGYNGAPPGPLGPPGPSLGRGVGFPSGGPGPEYPRTSDFASRDAGDQSTKREVCRKFLLGLCTRGDRCWHIHDQQAPPHQDGGARPPRMEMNQERRKTRLCTNFPQGTCRFGDRCSFAHGEDDLDRSNQGMRRPPAQSQDPMQGPSPRGASPHGSFQAQRASPAVSPHRPYPPAAYDRPAPGPAGKLGMGPSRPPQAAAALSGVPAAGSGSNQWTGAAAASGYRGYAGAQPAQTYGSGTPVSSSSHVPAPQATMQSRDEDEVEAARPEFDLQYDEDE